MDKRLKGGRSGVFSQKDILEKSFTYVGSTQTLRVKTISAELKSVLDLVVNVVNFVKSKALETRLETCHEAGSKHDTLVLRTDTRRSSKSPAEIL